MHIDVRCTCMYNYDVYVVYLAVEGKFVEFHEFHERSVHSSFLADRRLSVVVEGDAVPDALLRFAQLVLQPQPRVPIHVPVDRLVLLRNESITHSITYVTHILTLVYVYNLRGPLVFCHRQLKQRTVVGHARVRELESIQFVNITSANVVRFLSTFSHIILKVYETPAANLVMI